MSLHASNRCALIHSSLFEFKIYEVVIIGKKVTLVHSLEFSKVFQTRGRLPVYPLVVRIVGSNSKRKHNKFIFFICFILNFIFLASNLSLKIEIFYM